MIITQMQYLEPVRRGQLRGTNYEFVHIQAHDVKTEERGELEKIAKNSTYTLGLMGNHRHSDDGSHCRYRGIRNKVTFVEQNGVTHVYISGPYATDIGFKIGKLPFVEFSPSKNDVVKFFTEGSGALEDMIDMLIERLSR